MVSEGPEDALGPPETPTGTAVKGAAFMDSAVSTGAAALGQRSDLLGHVRNRVA
jgi:hypothetical protein